MKKTKFFNKVERKWLLIDAKDKVLGRVATRIAKILQGKHKPTYSPNFLCGDNVVVINAKYIRVTGNKLKEKIYDKYSGYPDGRKEISLENLMKKNSTKALYLAVKGMLPKNLLAKKMLRSLKIYPEEEHRHSAQNPQKIEV
ncbi:MAG: 50S ribosomal protein L13 [Candidatus Omnitrophica bacterium 4484_70.1]|nr:MAG: 50S ribosomal protein L13 [Candidatus Omnitrophica bacterium 4484_70.1]